MVAISRLTARTEHGSLLAVPHRGVLQFRNVPFAAPPFGARRFLPPERPARWDGLRDGAEAGVGMPQPSFGDPMERYFAPKRQGDDALTLQVQTPELGRCGMPVMVWLHGGGFVTGAGSAKANDGYAFARDGIVHVSINFRLGFDGYGLFEDSIEKGADNLGLRDQVAALEWVQRNIAAFGGDPSSVTIAGQASGGTGVSYLLASPAARGLFTRAISQSGSSSIWTSAVKARSVANRLSEYAGRMPRTDAMRDLDFDATRALTARMLDESCGNPRSSRSDEPLPFCGVVGTQMLPEPPLAAIASGSADGIAVLAGTTNHENAGSTVDLVHAHDDADYLYEFAWESLRLSAGNEAAHGVDIPFANDDLENMLEMPRGRRLLAKSPCAELARFVHTAFADFVKTGDPGWSPYRPDRQVTMVFDETCDTVLRSRESALV